VELLIVQLVEQTQNDASGLMDTSADSDCNHKLVHTASFIPRLLVVSSGKMGRQKCS